MPLPAAPKRFWHKGDSFALTISQVLRQVLDIMEPSVDLKNVLERGFNLAMPRAAASWGGT
jgi:hypothetical protein